MTGRAAVAGLVLAAAAFAAPVAVAGDYAALQPIGFSSDGNVFAFEEYGVQDGSGFPYSTVYVLDTRNDSFLPGAPVRAVVEEDKGELQKARREARRRAAPLLDAYRLVDTPGIFAAYNPVTEAEAPPHTLTYDAFPADAPFRKTYRLTLEEKTFEPEGACRDFLKDVKGFRLTMTGKAGKAASDILQDDQRIPQSRRCPTGYRIGGVVTRINDDGSEVHVVMILVESLGFEGTTDGRWIAVPVRIPG
jgi:predicted secreted protein